MTLPDGTKVTSIAVTNQQPYTAPMSYRLLAIDLDSTLLNSGGVVSDRNLSAIESAVDAGLLVVPCTGRGWREARMPLLQLYGQLFDHHVDGPFDADDDVKRQAIAEHPGVFVTGASVCDVYTGASMDLAYVEPNLALAIVERLADLPEAVLVYRDETVAGHEYLITGSGILTPNTQWWFGKTHATVHYQSEVTVDDLQHVLRVCVVAARPRMQIAKDKLADLGDRVFFHSFEAVQAPNPDDSMHIIEIFGQGTDKWRGLQWIAEQHGIEAKEIAAIGDEVNDVAMLKHAGCGIAVGNAVDVARHAADVVLKETNNEDGVAVAIEQLIAGAW